MTIEGDIQTKLSAARTRLILDKPFLGALVLRLPMQAADPDWCQTVATDAKTFFYNEHYINALQPEHLAFVLAHEGLHCALSHFARRQHRDPRRWDIACDLAINALLVDDGLQAPPGYLCDLGFKGMTAEEIYPSVHDQFDKSEDQHAWQDPDQEAEDSQQQNTKERTTPELNQQDQPAPLTTNKGGQESQGLAPRPEPLLPDEQESLSQQWQQRMAGAAQLAMQAGKMSGEMARLIDHLLQPQLPWRNLLAHYLTNLARDDYSYSRPSARRGEPAIYPSLRSAQVNISVAVDTSGSIADEELQEFLSEINAIKSQVQARITLLACDAELATEEPQVFDPWEKLELPGRFHGGGGTSFKPVFKWQQKQDQMPDVLVYFTDAEGEFPEYCPAYPVLWLVKGKSEVPWGQRVQLN
jgi:predicted metal-dependent peptidase